ncbi:unnamed protein product [Cuscuta campestris]|uniref:RING-type E3 ubiquitin transferase n=1 Tax=Cuscuta campestris TaxID=132261 RepID=A0A484LQV0_9ASTE|nr:unnamed protein product [Cuscuta campestris]
MPDPVENLWPYPNASSFSDWDSGESNSLPNGHSNVYGSTPEVLGHVWLPSSSSSRNYLVADRRSEEREFDYSNGLIHENRSNAYGVTHPIGRAAMQHSSPNISLENSNVAGGPYCNLSGPHISRSCTPLGIDNEGTSSYDSGSFLRNRYDPDSFPNTWCFACKRKALDGSSKKSFACGSLSSNPQAENAANQNAPCFPLSSFSLFMPSNAGVSEQANSRNSSGSRLVACNEFQPSSAHRTAESSTRNFDIIENFGFQLLPERTALGPPGISTPYVSQGHFSSSPNLWDSLSLSMNSINPTNQYPPMASTTNSPMVHDETGFGGSFTNNGANSRYLRANETRNSAQVNWTPDIASSSRNHPSCFGIGPQYHTHTLFPSTRDTNQNQASTSSHQRLSEMPWNISAHAASEPGGSRIGRGVGNNFQWQPWATTSEDSFRPSHWLSTSREDPVTSSQPHRRGNHQQYFWPPITTEVAGDNRGGTWRALGSDFEGRYTMELEMLQVLEAMRRPNDFPTEVHPMFNMFMNEVAEMHDRHRDMRLDVDNMTYEELLALEEHIGNVNTGLSEATILRGMKRRKYYCFFEGLSSDLEPCSICQEEYINADDIGTLKCGHDFHTNCIKQWLMLKNLCPICKMTGLDT